MHDPEWRSLAASGRFTRRTLLGWGTLGPVALALAPQVSEAQRIPPRPSNPLEPAARRWPTWLVTDRRALLPPPPPRPASEQTRAELAELADYQARRSPAAVEEVRLWDRQGGAPVWTHILLETIKATATDPVRAARALALLHVAMADATVVAWYAKYRHHRLAPARFDPRLHPIGTVPPTLPTYPSEHAAIAGAAQAVLDYLYPQRTVTLNGEEVTFGELALAAIESRLWAGTNYRSDLAAGVALGQAVGALAVTRGQNDGSDAVWDTETQPGRRFGPPHWQPTPPAFAFPPLHPLAGTWRTWALASGSQFRLPPPPALEEPFPSPRFLAEVAEVKQIADTLTDPQAQIALFWADNPGQSYTPPGHWADIARAQIVSSGWSTPRATRALALVAIGLADSAIACWDTKYAYWILRPVTAIRNLSGYPFHDPDFLPFIPTPPFPAYTSGHSTFSGCAATLLEWLFPGGTVGDAFGVPVPFSIAAAQAAVSRLYGGIHFRSDNDQGLRCGQQIARLIIRRERAGGLR